MANKERSGKRETKTPSKKAKEKASKSTAGQPSSSTGNTQVIERGKKRES